ncbi:hypothetical protein L596_027367 [Steinernema carpocapsae]|uniref:Uncharacterized protein n=1 Tax=Steinernema carpocapsae TaxID=34508 RepID=A0A4U5M499_STECR|nr:hypothetical protein L596_027367 [Steinernema carpocapsae]
MVLWLGISIISVIEMIGFICVVFMFFCCGKHLVVEPTEDEMMKDKRYRGAGSRDQRTRQGVQEDQGCERLEVGG